MVRVTNTTYSSLTSRENLTSLTRRKFDDTITTLTRSQLSEITCRTNEFGTLTGTHLNVVDDGTHGDVGKGKGITYLRCCLHARHQGCTNLQSIRSNNITFLTISIEKQCDTCRAVRIVLDCLYYGWNTIFLSLEVDETILLLVTTAHVADSHLTGVVSTTGRTLTVNEYTLVYMRCPELVKEEVVLPHALNSIRIEYVMPEYRGEKGVLYSCYLEGYEKEMSTMSHSSSKEYTKLEKGKYIFHVKARNLVDGTESESQIVIRILPAWYETWWAYLLYIILIVTGMWALLRYMNLRAEKELTKVKKEKERQMKEQQMEFHLAEEKKEKELAKLRSKQLEVELKHKSSELSDSAMNLVRKNDMLQAIDQNMEQLSESVRREEAKARLVKKIGDIRKEIKMHMNDDDNWNKFEENFNLVYDNFSQKIMEAFPQLKKSDLKLCVYLRMGLSSKEMASLLNTSVRSIETARYRLRKKLDIDTGSNLTDFIQSFGN